MTSVRVDGYTKDTFVNDDFLDGLALYLDVNPKAVVRRHRKHPSRSSSTQSTFGSSGRQQLLSVSTRSLLIMIYGSVDVDYVLSDAEYIQSLIDKINAGYDTVEGTTAKSSFITSLQQAGFTSVQCHLGGKSYQLMPAAVLSTGAAARVSSSAGPLSSPPSPVSATVSTALLPVTSVPAATAFATALAAAASNHAACWGYNRSD